MQIRGKNTEERIQYATNFMVKHPKFFRFWLGPFRAAIGLYHPDTVRELLKTSGKLKLVQFELICCVHKWKPAWKIFGEWFKGVFCACIICCCV